MVQPSNDEVMQLTLDERKKDLIIKMIPTLVKIFKTIMKAAKAALPDLNKLLIEVLKGIDKLKTVNNVDTPMNAFGQLLQSNSTAPTDGTKLDESDFIKILVANLPLIISIIMKFLNVASDQVGEIVKAVIQALSGSQMHISNPDEIIAKTIYHMK